MEHSLHLKLLLRDTKVLAIREVEGNWKLSNLGRNLWTELKVFVAIVKHHEGTLSLEAKRDAWQDDFTTIEIDLGLLAFSSEFDHKVGLRAISIDIHRNASVIFQGL